MGDCYVNLSLSNWKMNFISKNSQRKAFFINPRHQFVYPSVENEFVVPNHLTNRDYYVNPCLSNWKTNINSKNGGKRYFSYETKAWLSFIPMRRTHLWCLIVKRKEFIMRNYVCRNPPTNIISKMVEREVFLMKQ